MPSPRRAPAGSTTDGLVSCVPSAWITLNLTLNLICTVIQNVIQSLHVVLHNPHYFILHPLRMMHVVVLSKLCYTLHSSVCFSSPD